MRNVNKLSKMAEMAVDLSVNKIVLLQALVRGFLVRRKLLEVRKEFEEILNELETAETNFVCWKKDALGFPLITRDPKVLKSVNEQTKSSGKENEDEIKESDFTEEKFVAKPSQDGETMLNTGDQERVYGEKDAVDGELVLESHASEASNSESCDDHSEFQINRAVCVENNKSVSTSMQKHRPLKHTFLPEEPSSEKHRFSIPNSELTNQRDFGDESYPHRVNMESPLPLNSTMKPGSTDEQETSEAVQQDSTSETLQSYFQGRPPLRDQARLSDTWLTDRSFDTVVDEEPRKGLPTDPVKLRQLKDHIGMELLWTEQAIQSRKKYLSLKTGLEQTVKDDQDRTVQ